MKGREERELRTFLEKEPPCPAGKGKERSATRERRESTEKGATEAWGRGVAEPSG